jgi:hypothetical protein
MAAWKEDHGLGLEGISGSQLLALPDQADMLEYRQEEG